MEEAARALAGMKIPSTLDEAYEMAYKVWYVSPLGVGMVLGLLVMGLFKLFSVRLAYPYVTFGFSLTTHIAGRKLPERRRPCSSEEGAMMAGREQPWKH